MAKFSLSFDTDNAAFANGNMAAEITRILQEVCNRINDGWADQDEYFREFLIFDINGNRVGTFEESEWRNP